MQRKNRVGCLRKKRQQKPKTKEGERKQRRASGQRGTERAQCFPASAFWTAACWMIGLECFNVTSSPGFDINTPQTPLRVRSPRTQHRTAYSECGVYS